MNPNTDKPPTNHARLYNPDKNSIKFSNEKLHSNNHDGKFMTGLY